MIFGYIGLPRSGKTTMLGRYIKKKGGLYEHIYICGESLCEDYVGDLDDYITYIHPYEIGTFEPIHGSLFVLCEAGTYFNNRLFSSIPPYCTDFFALHGHYQCDIAYDSQMADVDLKLLNRTDHLYVVKKSLVKWFSHVSYVSRDITPTDDGSAMICRYIMPATWFKRLLHHLTFRSFWLFRPFYYGIFDTHSDVLFDGNKFLPKSDVSIQCPKKHFSNLKYYFKELENYELIQKKAVEEAQSCGEESSGSDQ